MDNIYELLIVDDDFTYLEIHYSILKEEFDNIIIHKASNTRDAIDIFKNNKIKIVLLDMFFGEDISGIDLYHKLKEIRTDFKSIAISSYDSKYGFKCGKVGINDFLRKPVDIDTLINSIKFQLKTLDNDIKGNVFCIMPFMDTLYDTYLFGIKEPLNSLGYNCFRIDEEIFNDSMIDKIKDSILISDFIVADLSFANPNVYYEIGYAHALNKKVILIASSLSDLKFDLQHMRTIIYDNKINELINC